MSSLKKFTFVFQLIGLYFLLDIKHNIYNYN